MAAPQNKPLVVLAAGGTGGHVFPAEALAAELIGRGFHLVLVTDRRGGNLKGRLAELETYKVRAGGVAGKSLFSIFFSIFEIIIGTLEAWLLIRRLKPVVAVGFGGYASVPTMLAAVCSGTKTALHEQNAVLGRGNLLLANWVKKIATSFEEVTSIPQTSKPNIVVTGMPVRPAVILVRDRAYPDLGPNDNIHLVVFGGSQGAHIFSTVVPGALKYIDEGLRKRIKVTQQSRPEDLERTEEAYRALGVDAEISSFFNDIPDRIANAHLVICRSGASTIAEITTIGRPAIMVPYFYAVDDHQSRNAHAVCEVGGGWVIPEVSFTDHVLAGRIESLFSIPKILENAAAASKVAGKPDAAGDLADMVVGLILNDLNEDQRRSHERLTS